jgi:TolA-binding protein
MIGTLKFWQSSDIERSQSAQPELGSSSSRRPLSEFPQSSSMIDVTQLEIQARQELAVKLRELQTSLEETRQERLAFQTRIDAKIERETRKLEDLEKRVAFMASQITPQAPAAASDSNRLLSDLILELDPDLL